LGQREVLAATGLARIDFRAGVGVKSEMNGSQPGSISSTTSVTRPRCAARRRKRFDEIDADGFVGPASGNGNRATEETVWHWSRSGYGLVSASREPVRVGADEIQYRQTDYGYANGLLTSQIAEVHTVEDREAGDAGDPRPDGSRLGDYVGPSLQLFGA
jgi:hypothetical protein